MTGRAQRGRLWVAAGAAALLLPGCSGSLSEAEERAVEAAREHNAYVGAAAALLVAMAVRHVADARDEQRPWVKRRPAVRGRLPGLLLAAMMASEVTGMMLLGALGAFAGYLFGPTPPVPSDHELGFMGMLVVGAIGAPVFATFTVIGLKLLHLTNRLPAVRTNNFGWAAVGHGVALLLGVSVAFGNTGDIDFWRFAGAALAGVSAVGVVGYSAGIAARRRVR